MASFGCDAEGIDPTPDAVAAARWRGARVTQGDVTTVAPEEGTFDAITFRLVFEHIPDPVGALAACHRALKAGGPVWIATPNLDSDASRTFGDAWIFAQPPRHPVLYTPGALQRLLRRCGFEPLLLRPSRQAGRLRPLPPGARARARPADMRALLQPERADLVVVVAQKR
jgi:SAM-dependent methyltransferase